VPTVYYHGASLLLQYDNQTWPWGARTQESLNHPGRVFYKNTASGATQWERPAPQPSHGQPAPPPPTQDLLGMFGTAPPQGAATGGSSAPVRAPAASFRDQNRGAG
jgi:hypothetical protein